MSGTQTPKTNSPSDDVPMGPRTPKAPESGSTDPATLTAEERIQDLPAELAGLRADVERNFGIAGEWINEQHDKLNYLQQHRLQWRINSSLTGRMKLPAPTFGHDEERLDSLLQAGDFIGYKSKLEVWFRTLANSLEEKAASMLLGLKGMASGIVSASLTPEQMLSQDGVFMMVQTLEQHFVGDGANAYELAVNNLNKVVRRGDESMSAYVSRFKTAMLYSRNAGVNLADQYFCLQFLNQAHISSTERALLLSSVGRNLHIQNLMGTATSILPRREIAPQPTLAAD